MSAYLVSKLEADKKKRVRVVWGVSFTVIALIAFSIILFQLLLQNEKIEIASHITEVAKQSAVSANELLRGDFQSLNLFAHLLESEPQYLDKKHIDGRLTSAIKRTGFLSMAVIYPNGLARIYDTNRGFQTYKNVKNLNYFKYGMQGHEFVDFEPSRYDNDNVIVLFAVPVMGANKKPIALITAARGIEDFSKAVAITTFNNHAVVHVIDNKGNLILRDKSTQAVLKSSIFENNEVSDEKREKALKSDKPESYWFKDINGVRKVASFIPLGYNNWKLLAILPFSAINHNSQRVLQFAILFFLLINAIVLVAVRYNLKVKARSDNMVMDLALQDDVTHALNKTSFFIETEKILLKESPADEKIDIIAMDIDNFKVINEIYDMEKGNQVLKDIASILSKAIGENGIFARFSDDLFTILYKYTDANMPILLIDDITKTLSKYRLSVKINPSFGIYEVEDRTTSVNTLCDRANIARRSIKGMTAIRYAFYDASLSRAILEEKQIEDSMRQALENGEFEMYLQPKINMQTMLPCGSEALVRWNHPEKGLVPPAKFIPLFEKNGFVIDVDKFIWEEACKVIRRWLDEGKTPLPVSVNLSRVHFKYEDLVDIIQKLVNKYNVPHKYLELELTESSFLDNEGVVNSTLVRLQQLGFTIAMDDFGMGYSSLNMLRKLPVNILKLDRGFINEAACSKRGFIVLNHVISMAKDLQTTIVCEGIETKEQAETLRKAGCDIAQGFLYAKPMPVAEYEKFVYSEYNMA